MSTKLGVSGSEATLDQPSRCGVAEEKIGQYRRMADGTLKLDYVAIKSSWRVSWSTLPKGGATSGRTEIRTEALRTGELRWSPPDEDESSDGWHTVLCSSYGEDLENVGGEEYYSINLVLDEV